MGIPKEQPTTHIYDLHDWYEARQKAQDRPTTMLWHAHRALSFQYMEKKMMDKGHCPCCHQYVPEWEKPKVPF